MRTALRAVLFCLGLRAFWPGVAPKSACPKIRSNRPPRNPRNRLGGWQKPRTAGVPRALDVAVFAGLLVWNLLLRKKKASFP